MRSATLMMSSRIGRPADGSSQPPVLFLDFDGVLHPVGEPAIDENFQLIDNEALFVWLPILESLLVPFPDVRIVVSSDWRRLFDDQCLIRLLGPLGSRFAGVVETYGASRSEEILGEVQRRLLARWIALDDHPSVTVGSRTDVRFIACASDGGISDQKTQRRLERMLNSL